MSKPQLYLLKPGYGTEANMFCPDCALMEGFFVYHPHLKAQVEFIYIDFDRPRAALVELLGVELQNSPALVFAEGDLPMGLACSEQTGRAYINDGKAICRWLGQQFHGMVPS